MAEIFFTSHNLWQLLPSLLFRPILPHKLVVVLRTLCISLGLILFFNLLFQIAYPGSVTRPNTQLDRIDLGILGNTDVIRRLGMLNQTKISIKTAEQEYEMSLQEIGITIDVSATKSRLQSYSLKERLVPFSFFSEKSIQPVMTEETTRLQAFANEIASKGLKQSKSAQLTQDANGVIDGAIGYRYDAESIMHSLRGVTYSDAIVLNLEPIKLEPKVNGATLQKLLDDKVALKNRQVEVQFRNEKKIVSGDLLYAWARLDVTEDAAILSYDQATMKQWLTDVSGPYYIANQPNTVVLRNGAVIQNSGGNDGEVVDIDATLVLLNEALLNNKSSVAAVLRGIPAGTHYVRTYSPTNEGLQMLITDWQNEHSWLRLGVVFQEVGGARRRAELNPNRQYFTASIYKMYTAAYLRDGITKGVYDPAAPLGHTRSLNDCLELMIVTSDSPCAEGAANAVGWTPIHNFVQANGFGSTNILPGNLKTTANDTTNFLEKLLAGQLLDGGQTAALHDTLARQKYRAGIPAGSRGAGVADKVGYHAGSWHDVAIVYHPKGTYVLSVMTTGGASLETISTLAARIYDTMNQ